MLQGSTTMQCPFVVNYCTGLGLLRMLIVSRTNVCLTQQTFEYVAASQSLESASIETLSASSNLHPSRSTRATLGVSTLPALLTAEAFAPSTCSAVLLSRKPKSLLPHASESPLYVHFHRQLHAMYNTRASVYFECTRW